MSRLVKSSSAWAGVTGPTSGMDRSMDFELARRGLNIVIVVCDPNQLQILSVADTITKTHAVQSKRVVFDLSFVSTAELFLFLTFFKLFLNLTLFNFFSLNLTFLVAPIRMARRIQAAAS